MTIQITFNKSTIDKIVPTQTRLEFQDTNIPELRLRVSPKGTKTFCIYKRLPSSKPIRVTLGTYPNLSPAHARKNSRKVLASIVDGQNPNDVARIAKIKNLTLQEVYEEYKLNRSLKEKTLEGYKSVLNNQLSKLKTLPLDKIDRVLISKIHSQTKSPAQANLSMRFLRAIFNFAKNEYLDGHNKSLFPDNPVQILSHRKQWNRISRRNTHLRKNEIPEFINAILEVKQNESYTGISICNALLFALFTGLRRSEILNLKWHNINFESEYFQIMDTKNGSNLELPITPHLKDILEEQFLRSISPYVFGAENSFGQIREPKKVINKIREICKSSCSFHDLRRTFATTAENLNIGTYKLKRLMNHCSGRDDVTAGYVILTAETLRVPAILIQKQIMLSN